MTKLFSVLFLVSACAASEDPTPGDDMTDDGTPDDGTPDGVESATLRFLVTTIFDERNDTIDFSTGEPIHTHAGEHTHLGGEHGCPDVYKYGYLMDATAPAFGRETTPNPLAFHVELKNADTLETSATAYRVRVGEAEIARDWTALPVSMQIALDRDAIPALGERATTYYVDVRTRDRKGVETITSACWNHHPLAAPLELAPVRTDIAAMTLAGTSPMSTLLTSSANDPVVLSQRFVHATAEPLVLAIDVATPTGTFARRTVDDVILTKSELVRVPCFSSDGSTSSDPLCHSIQIPADPADSQAGGMLTTGTWSLLVIDEATNAPAAGCTITELRAACQLAPRGANEPPKAYRIVLMADSLRDLAPSNAAVFAEHTLAGKVFTGTIGTKTRVCTEWSERTTPTGITTTFCGRAEEYTRFVALDHARIAFDAVPWQVSTSHRDTLPFAPLGASTIAPFTWDAGDADLPGPK